MSTELSGSDHRQHSLPLGRGLGVVAAIGAVIAISAFGGCQKTALRPDDTRSQFDRYDQARNQSAQPFLEDEFGRRTPNLSERLLIRGE